jgi:hypothetical protein
MSDEEKAAGAMTTQTRGRLGDLRRALLGLHRALLESERRSYERGRGAVGGSGEFLQLVINDPWFAWLRPVSELIVRVDELLEPAQEATEDDALRALGQAAALVRPAGGGEFGRRYGVALQESPDVVLAHAGVAKLFGTPAARGGMAESEIDDILADSFPASDPPSWTLGTDHRPAGRSQTSPRDGEPDGNSTVEPGGRG